MNRLLQFIFKFRNESGNVLVIVAIGMMSLLGFTALAIDGGRMYSEKSTLQKALDASVLAGGQVLLTSEAQARSVVKDISQKNSFTLTDGDITITNSYIKVTKETTVPMTFAKVLGINEAKVAAKAKVTVGPLKKGQGITPLAVDKSAVPNGTELKCDNTGQNNGNCGFLDLDGGGANSLADAIMNGSTVAIDNEYATTEPGQKWGPVKDAFQFLIDSDANKPHCQSPDTADNSCKRVLFVPVIESWVDAQGKSTVKIVGLAAYWLQEIKEPKRIIGQFIKMIGPGELGESGIGEFNLYGVKLVE